jgi:hypothetical protein
MMSVQLGADVDISLSGRRPAAYDKVLEARPELEATRFLQCDIDDAASLAAALKVGSRRHIRCFQW